MVGAENQSYDAFWKRAESSLRFAWLPVKSYESGKRIWLSKAYRFRRNIRGFEGDPPINEDRWMTKEEAMLRILKG